ncbi:SDR family NAD(P)-dependent oxidoreductase [Cellulosimicrobium cellulans]|uniref:SDR family NAD(P)-dependent oxidoreductase n=1 Tax=Cellulosimicrobium cellulans TaxID=1710 RepID=UPI00130E0EB0|nr:SDR family NAD(P)-dependent oxidoreductase [Cellulosimicrobium cellulans]
MTARQEATGAPATTPKTVVITGASSGIGAAAARTLAARGHRVVVVGRCPARTRAVAEEIGAEHHVADFADLAQVRGLADTLAATCPRIDVLANNAGAIMGHWASTVDRLERTLQVNHLAPFLLTARLLPTLAASRATVIQTASEAARVFARLRLQDLNSVREYTPQVAYGNAKLANILFTQELQHRHGALGTVHGVNAVAFHPGIVGTGFAAETTHPIRHVYHGRLRRLLTTAPERGADQLVLLAEGTAGVTFTPGIYYVRRRPARRVHPLMRDPRVARELWNRSAELVGALA